MQHNHILIFTDISPVIITGEYDPEASPIMVALQLNQYPSKKAAFKDFLDDLIDESWPDDETTPEGLSEWLNEYVRVELHDLEEPFKEGSDLTEELIDYVKSGEYKPFEQ